MTDQRLRKALRGVRGLVLDADGVIVLKGAPLPGSVEALQTLTEGGVPAGVVSPLDVLVEGDAVAQSADQVVTESLTVEGVSAAFAPCLLYTSDAADE